MYTMFVKEPTCRIGARLSEKPFIPANALCKDPLGAAPAPRGGEMLFVNLLLTFFHSFETTFEAAVSEPLADGGTGIPPR
jgi:hypothetical protein